MPMKYATVEALRDAQAARTRNGFDNYILVSGEVGMWKSLWARKWAGYSSRRKLTVDHIHFTQEDWMRDFVTLQPGDATVMDEWRAHKRQAMHGFRGEQLDTNKEGRQIGAVAIFCYPDAGEVDTDLLKRFEWWHHKPSRKMVEIRQKVSQLLFDPFGKPFTDVKWPLVARFPVTGSNDPLRVDYEAKKEARMRDRAARFREAYGDEPAPTDGKAQTRIKLALVSMAQAELGRSLADEA